MKDHRERRGRLDLREIEGFNKKGASIEADPLTVQQFPRDGALCL